MQTHLSRREFLAQTVAAAGGLLAIRSVRAESPAPASAAGTGSESTKRAQPNILVVCGDDHARWAAHCYGNSELVTPNLDWLARSGLKFTRATTPCPVCSPGRAAIFTGRLPSQTGMHDFLGEGPAFTQPWLRDELFISELLHARGYYTGLIGKWHCSSDSSKPERGFDRWVSYDDRRLGWANEYLHQGLVEFSVDGQMVTHRGFQSDFITDQAVRFIEGVPAHQPFFLFVGYTETHFPFASHPERLVDRYRHSSFRDIPVGESSPLPATPSGEVPPDPREALAQYYAGVSYMDEQIGRLLSSLEGTGALDNTLVVYTSDHGHMNGHHGRYGKGNGTKPQNFYQESVQIPCLIRWPIGGLAGGRVCDLPFDHLDLFQTLAAAGGAAPSSELLTERRYAGRNFLAGTNNWREFHFTEYGNARMVMNQRYKLVLRYPPHFPQWQHELYDLQEDPRETRNLIGDISVSRLVRDLKTELEQHFSRHEVARNSGTHILSLPLCNPTEPWR